MPRTRIEAISTLNLPDEPACVRATRPTAAKAAFAAMTALRRQLQELERCFDIEWKDLLTDSEARALAIELEAAGTLALVEGRTPAIAAISPDRVSRIAEIVDSVYELRQAA